MSPPRTAAHHPPPLQASTGTSGSRDRWMGWRQSCCIPGCVHKPAASSEDAPRRVVFLDTGWILNDESTAVGSILRRAVHRGWDNGGLLLCGPRGVAVGA